MRKTLFLLALLLPQLLASSRASALELLLEENRGESGTIGYVDIDRVFKEYSGTTGAKEDFFNEIKKKEDALNKKKTAIFTLKADIAKLRQERAFALTLPSLMATQRSIEQAAKTEAAERTALEASTQAAVAASTAALTGPVQVSTGAVSPAIASLPGLSSAPAAASGTAPVNLSTAAPAAPPQPSTAATPAPGLDLPGISKIPLSSFKFSVSTSVPVIDAAIAQKEADLAAKEDELRKDQKLAEKELLDYENHKSELLLGRIYVALKELAVKEEVSVVVDKRNILYGQKAVDLTDKLIEKLEKGDI